MTAGVPGTGIGGLFYLTAALLLPLRGLVSRARGARVSWKAIAGKAALAAGVFLGIWLTGWLLGLFLAPAARTMEVAAGLRPVSLLRNENIVRWAALAGGFATLGLVLLAVQIARLLNRKR
jgi:hypothetical protein